MNTPTDIPAIQDFDVVIVGSGLAGLTVALHLAPTHRVAVITKRAMSDGASDWAQGGIAAVLGEDDSIAVACATTRWSPAPACATERPRASSSSTRPRRSTGCVELRRAVLADEGGSACT